MVLVSVDRPDILVGDLTAKCGGSGTGTVITVAISDQSACVKEAMVNRLHVFNWLAVDAFLIRQPEAQSRHPAIAGQPPSLSNVLDVSESHQSSDCHARLPSHARSEFDPKVSNTEVLPTDTNSR